MLHAKPLLILLCFGLIGCSNVEYTPYSGGQQSWPTAPGAFVQKRFAVPIYYGDPPRAYRVLGMLEASGRRRTRANKADALEAAADQAKKMGADALIVKEESRENVGVNNIGDVGIAVRQAHAKVIAIKFLR